MCYCLIFGNVLIYVPGKNCDPTTRDVFALVAIIMLNLFDHWFSVVWKSSFLKSPSRMF